MRYAQHRIKDVAVVALVVLASIACSKNAEAPPPAQAAGAPAPAPAAVPRPTAGTQAPAPAASQVIAKGEGNNPGFRVEITELKRTGNDMVTLKMTFINESREQIQQRLYDAGLLDLVEKRRYSPVNKGNAYECICSGAHVSVAAHERSNAWIRFPAPPATVEKVGIELEGFQPIDDVPISR
jgi:hypothetical protein